VSEARASKSELQRLRRLLGRRSSRLDDGAFVIEGALLVAEALEAGLPVEAIYAEDGADVPAGAPVRRVDRGGLAKVGSTVTPQPVMAVASLPQGAAPVGATFVVVAAGIADPGNLGTIVRSAEASGADALVLTVGSADPWNPKVVRSAAGSSFRLPIVVDADPTALGLPLLGAVARGGPAPEDVDLRAPVALVIGNESRGIDPALRLDGTITIPQRGRAESLNAAMAATVLCFEVARQRRAVSRR
jgi:TrmH family RNA methyltransferase